MDITNFVVSGRDQALLYGDYSTYRASLSRKLLSIRKKLGLATKKGAKFTKKAPVTPESIASNHDFVHLLLLTSERAWAHAMSMKAAHSVDTKGITGSTRSHIISRLHKAANIADDLIILLSDQSTSGASEVDVLEARAYSTSLSGAEHFEKQSWEACVKNYSESWVIYSVLAKSSKTDTFKDLLSATIEPSIRYGAYQMRMPRTVAVPAIARKYFPNSDPKLVAAVERLDPFILQDASKAKTEVSESEATSRTITWRSRTVDLEDATIGAALSSVATATARLSETLSSTSSAHPKDRAAAYDEILIASQDAVDATKHAIDELVAEGVGKGDKRMQSLQITRTAVSYDMISWRIGRNRVLTGEYDGALPDGQPIANTHKSKKQKTHLIEREESSGRRLALLREKVVMYDSTLQSLDSIKELPGVAADTGFLGELEAKYQYFRALKCLAIARSHSVLSDHKNALALLSRASTLLNSSVPTLASLPAPSASTPPNISITASSAKSLSLLLSGELHRHRALVELHNITASQDAQESSLPLIERLSTYPLQGVNLKNIVTYPPKLEPIPVKPLFFDVAWNYIEYPGQTTTIKTAVAGGKTEQPQVDSKPDPPAVQKKGWFGFGGR